MILSGWPIPGHWSQTVADGDSDGDFQAEDDADGEGDLDALGNLDGEGESVGWTGDT